MRVEVDGARLFFDIEGAQLRPDGPWMDERPTVVIIHTGPGSDHTAYKEHIGPRLAETAQVVYVDVRGCGLSDRCTPESWNVETWSSDLRGLLTRIGVERPVVLGAGFGCYTALRHAQRWPGEVSKLVLSNPNARAVRERIVARYRELGGPKAEAAAREFFEHPSELTVAGFLRDCFPVMVPPVYAARLLLMPLWNLELAIHWTATEMDTLDLRPELGSIEAPTLVLAGSDDPQYPPESIAEVIDGLRDVRVEHYPGARHSVFRDAPESLDAVVEFVA
jgi:pimeloyl-ACP methyl ester carboxylesterase